MSENADTLCSKWQKVAHPREGTSKMAFGGSKVAHLQQGAPQIIIFRHKTIVAFNKDVHFHA